LDNPGGYLYRIAINAFRKRSRWAQILQRLKPIPRAEVATSAFTSFAISASSSSSRRSDSVSTQ
jgi:hypothetical protein